MTTTTNINSKDTAMTLNPIPATKPVQDGVSLQEIKEPQEPSPVEIIDTEKLSKRLDKATDYIRKEVSNVAKSFCRIGFKLWEVREDKLYLGQGFKNVYEYSASTLSLQKASTASYIAVCERYSAYALDGKPSAKLKPEYSNYSYGQLSLMLSLPESKAAEIKPETTCKEIREIKKKAAIESELKDTSKPTCSKLADSKPTDSNPTDSKPIGANPPFCGLIFSDILSAKDIPAIAKLAYC